MKLCMFKFSLLIICALLFIGCSSEKNIDPTAKIEVKRLAKELIDATVAGNYNKVIEHTYPTVVNALGGQTQAIKTLETSMKNEIKDKGMIISSFQVGEPGIFYTEDNNMFSVLPTTLEMKIVGGNVFAKSYLLGISPDGGKSWKFVDGFDLHKQNVREKLLPKMPAKLKLPVLSPPVITKEK